MNQGQLEPPAGVLFDLDGTLVDSRADLAASANAIRAERGRPSLPDDVVIRYVGDGARALLRRVLAHPDGPGDSPTPVSEEALALAYDDFVRIYGARLLDRTRPYPGIVALLDDLADRQLFVATNKPRVFTVAILEGLELAGRFARVVAGDDPPRRKPHPDHLRACLAGTGLAPASCAMVGDSVNDIAPARALGMRAIAVAWGLVPEGTLREAAPQALVHDAPGLLAALGGAAGAR